MARFGTKHILVLLLLAISLGYVTSALVKEEESSVLNTSVLAILKKVAEQRDALPPAVFIEKATVRQVADPTSDFPYYKYSSTIILKNEGGPVVNKKLKIFGNKNQKHSFIRNTDRGFSVNAGGSYIVRGYEIFADSRFNSMKIELGTEIVDEKVGSKSEEHDINLFYGKARISDFGVKKAKDSLRLKFNVPNNVALFEKVKLYKSYGIGDTGGEATYHEELSEEDIFSFAIIEADEVNTTDSSWKEVEGFDYENPVVEEEGKTVFYQLRAYGEDTEEYAVSDILKVSNNENLSRAAFAKLFVEDAGVKVDETGQMSYEDVDADSWYGDYVHTLYNLGLIPFNELNFYPSKSISRAEALQIVMDYFDVDIAGMSDSPVFYDVEIESNFAPYIKALASSSVRLNLGDEFRPDAPATKAFLNFLINEYREGN